MKFKHFDVADVFGPDDVEQAKAYMEKRGYYADHLEELDDFIENKRRIGTLHSIVDKADTFERLIVGCEFDYPCPYTYFLPLDKVKKTEPTEKKLKWRPCKDIEELEDLLNCDVLAFVGRVLELKDKISEAKFITTITGIEVLPTVDSQIYSIFLGNGNVYSFEDLFENFEIFVDGQYQPFGVEVK